MKWRRPWERVTPAEQAESIERLRDTRSRQRQVDEIERTARDLIARNHLGESIHKALGGRA